MKNNKLIILSFLFSNTFLNAVYLNEVGKIKKLSNYNELKNIEVKRIVDWNNIERNKSKDKVYVLGETEPFTGSAIKGLDNQKNIEGIYFYENGHLDRNTYEYYNNGQLRIFLTKMNDKSTGESKYYYSNGKLQANRYYKNNIIQSDIEYRQNGTIFRTFKATEGLNGITTVYFENGKDIQIIAEVTQDYSKKGQIATILNGKLQRYDKQRQLQAIFNFKNDSIAGLPQELYYPNGKVKYYALAKDNNQKNPTFTQTAISYYDNGQEKENCDEVDSGMWMCKKYDKNGKFKGEVQKGGQPIETSNFWANFFMGVLNILFQ